MLVMEFFLDVRVIACQVMSNAKKLLILFQAMKLSVLMIKRTCRCSCSLFARAGLSIHPAVTNMSSTSTPHWSRKARGGPGHHAWCGRTRIRRQAAVLQAGWPACLCARAPARSCAVYAPSLRPGLCVRVGRGLFVVALGCRALRPSITPRGRRDTYLCCGPG